MMIVVGTRVSTRRAGTLAWFCPVCRDARPFDAVVVSRVKHLYGMALGRGTPQHARLTCPECWVVISVPPEGAERATDEAGLDIDELCRRTNPELFRELPERYEFEERLLTDRLRRDERLEVIAEAINALEFSYTATLRGGASHHASLAIVIVFLCCAIAAAMAGGMGFRGPLLWALIAGAVVFGAWAFYRAATDGARVARGPLAALIARSIASLHATREELDETLLGLRLARSRLARRLRAEDIEAALATWGARRGAPAQSVQA